VRLIGLAERIEHRHGEPHAGRLRRRLDPLAHADQGRTAETAGRGALGRRHDPGVRTLGEEDRSRGLASSQAQSFERVFEWISHARRAYQIAFVLRVDQPLRMIGPEGCGRPPAGSMVTAQVLGSAASATRSTSTRAAPCSSTPKVPAGTGGRPAAIHQSS